jgi:hypothetical protein
MEGIRASAVSVTHLHSARLMSSICFRDVLNELQGPSDDMPAHPRFRVEDWYRPRLGTFLYVNKDGVLCPADPECTSTPYSQLNDNDQGVLYSMPGQPEMGGDAEANPCTGSVVPTEFLVYDDLMGEIGDAGIFWPNPAPGLNSGQHTNQTPDTTDGLVFPYYLALRF